MAFLKYLYLLILLLRSCFGRFNSRDPKNFTRLVQFPIGDAFAIIDKRTGKNSYYGIFWELVETEKWEPQTFLVFNTVINHLTTVIDFGAWIGPTALYAAHFAREVFAMEPDLVAYQEAHRNINLNSERLRNIHIYHRCISTKRESVKMNRGPNAAGDSMSTVNRNNGTTGIPVQCDTLDSMVLEFNMQTPIFLKVDTEGFEAELVPTWHSFVLKYRPTIYLWMHQQLRKYSAIEKAGVIAVLRLFPFALEVKDCIRCDNTFVIVQPNDTSFELCQRCDYLLSFQKYF